MGWFDWVGDAVKLAGNIFSGTSSVANAINGIGGWVASQAGAKQTQKYNRENMKSQFDYSKKLMARQYKYAIKGQKQQYNYQNALQKQQQNWENMMSSTAHQREVQDLKNAGLNPILSANGGASTPSMGAGTIGMTSVAGQSEGLPSAPDLDYAQQIQNAISNAFEKQRIDNETKSVVADVTKKDAETKTEEARTELVNQEKTLKQSEELLNRQTLEFLPAKQRAELEQTYALTKAQTASANLAQIQARNSIIMTQADKILKEAETKYTNEKSRGYGGAIEGIENVITNFTNRIGKKKQKNPMYVKK